MNTYTYHGCHPDLGIVLRMMFKDRTTHTQETTVASAQGDTLDGMTIAQLREIAQRAERRAQEIAREQAEAKQRVQDAKDLVPPVGTEWEYNGRYWVTVKEDMGDKLVFSIPEKGGVIRGWWHTDKFSTTQEYEPKEYGGWVLTSSDRRTYTDEIARLALRVRA